MEYTITTPPPVQPELTLTFTGEEADRLLALLYWNTAHTVYRSFVGYDDVEDLDERARSCGRMFVSNQYGNIQERA